MERLNGLSLVTQQGETWAPGSFYFNPNHPSRGHLNLYAQDPQVWALLLGVSCRLLCSALGILIPRTSSLVLSTLSYFCCLDEVCCPQYFILHSGIYQNALPAAAGIRCGGTDFEKAMAGVLLCGLWTKRGPAFYSCLTLQCFQWKIK